MKKRIVSFLLILTLVFTLFPGAAMAANGDAAKEQVRVIVENTTYPKADGAAWEGILVDTWVEITQESTMMTCVGAALTEKGYTAKGMESNYITEIEGIAAGDACGQSGWMGTLNDWFTHEGFGSFTVKSGSLEAGDEIRIMHTMNLGADLGGVWGNKDKHLKDIKVDQGTMAPQFASETLEYTLTVPAETTGVVVTPTAVNKNYQVRASVDGKEYKRTATIPVKDGTVISVTCGDPSWPSMNDNKGSAFTYTITVAAEKAPVNPDLSAVWPSFRGNSDNNGVTSVMTPRTAEETELRWAKKMSTDWTDAPSPMIIADNAVFTMCGSTLKKMDLATGEVLAQQPMAAATNWGSVPPTYGDGMIFCPLSESRVQAFNAETLEPLWTYKDELSGQSQSPIAYADGKVYVGLGYNSASSFVCLNAADGSIVWRETDPKGYYWAGAVVVGDYVIYGGENGHVISRNKDTGKLVSDLAVEGAPNIRSTISHAEGQVFFTTKNAQFCKADFDSATGTLSNLKTVDCSEFGAESTSTPTIYNGIAYFGVGSFRKPQHVLAVDLKTMEILWSVEEPANPQCSVLLSTAYIDSGYVYLYVTYNNNPGGINVIKAKADGTEATQSVLFDAKGYEQYCICSVIADENGNIYYKNDSGHVMALGMSQSSKDKAEAEKVEALIAAIGEVTLDSQAKIEAARTAYEKLTKEQQALVSNYATLEEAEKTLEKLKEEAGNQAAVKEVETLIDAIGEVTLESKDKIEAARAAYEKLTKEQQKQVTNYSVLEAAEESLRIWQLPKVDAAKAYKTTGDHLESLAKKTAPVVNSIGGEWLVLGLVRSGREEPAGYYQNVLEYVKKEINDKEQLHRNKSTDNARVILALTATGRDVTNVAGHNLLKGLTDMKYLKKQGINGPIWALIAFDSHNYEIPAVYAGGEQVTRESLIETILAAQLPDGGWALGGTDSDPDMTAMAIQSLAPYYKSKEKVKTAVDKALDTLSKLQKPDGHFGSWGTVNSESSSQIIVALTSLGINPTTDSRFVKNGRSVVDALCDFYVEGGGFKHIAEGEFNGMASEQGYYALVSLNRLVNGQTRLFDMTDVTIRKPMPFTDVPQNQWYYSYVEYVYHNKLMMGNSDTTFAPEKKMTRGQLVTVLYRMAGSPKVEGTTPFTDLEKGSYYENAVIWANQNGIASGVTKTTFAPYNRVTREQMATFFARYAKMKGADMTVSADLSGFVDHEKVSGYAEKTMQWAVGTKLIQGVDKNILRPQGDATRAQAAAMLQRLDILLKG